MARCVGDLPVKDYEEAIAAANSTTMVFPARSSARYARTVFRAMRDIQAGLIYFNAGTTGAEPHLPFGGVKQSGNGHRELGWQRSRSSARSRRSLSPTRKARLSAGG